jgi:gas vesicle protein
MADPVAEVDKYIQTVTMTRDKLQDAGHKLSATHEQLEALESALEDKAGAFVQELEEFSTDSLQQGWGAIKDQIDEWTQHLGEVVNQTFTQGLSYLEEQENETSDLLSGMGHDLEQDFQELASQGFDLVEQGHEALEQEVGDLKELAEDAFKGLGDGIDAMESKLDGLKTATLDHFTDMVSDVTGDITSTMDHAFEQLSTAISDEVTNEVTEGFGDLGSEVTTMFTNFTGSVEDVASDLMEKGVEVFGDMLNHAKDEAMETITTEVGNAVEQFIEALLADFAESIAMMMTGAATTAALAPYVPLLVAAKNICGTINELLQIMNLDL